MIVAQYFNMFIFFSFIGWVYECCFCTFKTKHWQNRGFLYGPICPIYGSCVVAALIVFKTILPAVMKGSMSFQTYPVWEIFLVCAVGSAIAEFGTSWILEKCFHAVWWDYSKVPFNIQGRICLPASCGFGLAGIVIVKFLFPVMESVKIETNPLADEAIMLFLAVGIGMDLALTVASLTRIIDIMDNMGTQINTTLENGVQIMQQGPAAVAAAVGKAAESAGETAVIAAMLAGDAAREKAAEASESIQERLSDVRSDFSARERYHMRSISGYRPGKTGKKSAAGRVKAVFEKAQKKVGSPQDRQVQKKG